MGERRALSAHGAGRVQARLSRHANPDAVDNRHVSARPPLHRWLAVVPALALLVGVPLVNGVRRTVLGLPFLLFWIVACVLLTSAIMFVVAVLDRRHAARAADPRRAHGDTR